MGSEQGITFSFKKKRNEKIIRNKNRQSFAEIMKLTDIQEGIIVRCIQQLNETMQDVKDAARIIGNPALHKKMEDASNAIQRNIVFAASLYLQSENSRN